MLPQYFIINWISFRLFVCFTYKAIEFHDATLFTRASLIEITCWQPSRRVHVAWRGKLQKNQQQTNNFYNFAASLCACAIVPLLIMQATATTFLLSGECMLKQ